MTAWKVTCMCWLACATALADSSDPQARAREAFEVGQSAYRHGNFEAAIEAWEEAYALDPLPVYKFDLGQAHERKGNLTEALSAFELFLEQTEQSDPAYQVANSHVAMIRQRIGMTGLLLKGGPENGRILVDDVDMGRTPRPDKIPLSPGHHDLTVIFPGGSHFKAHVYLTAGEAVELNVGDPSGSTLAPPPASRTESGAPRARRDSSRRWQWLAPGIGAAAAGASAAVYAGLRQRALADCGETDYCADDAQRRAERQRSAGFAAAGLLLAAGATLITLGIVGRERGSQTAAACGVGAALAHCSLTF
jgi:tetratricopeptide (TPR) repeat protein